LILVDTSIWIDHFHKANQTLADVLERGDVVTHPFVVGEIACGSIRNRDEILELLGELPTALIATEEEALRLIEEQRLMGKGLGYIDVHLIASAMLTEGTSLWTADKKLRAFATRFRIAFAGLSGTSG
jgi:predicted nucleic acid-binding protein